MFDRRQFLKLSFLGFLAGNAHPAERKVPLPASGNRKVFLMNCFIAGTFYYEGFKSFWGNSKYPQKVLLRREPANPYDALAIAVLTNNGEKIGYVPRKKNEVIARLMDSGKALSAAAISCCRDEHSADIRIEITIEDV